MIKLEHITQTYVGNDGKVFEALKDVSISIRPGEIFGIIGRSAPVRARSFAASICSIALPAAASSLTVRI